MSRSIKAPFEWLIVQALLALVLAIVSLADDHVLVGLIGLGASALLSVAAIYAYRGVGYRYPSAFAWASVRE